MRSIQGSFAFLLVSLASAAIGQKSPEPDMSPFHGLYDPFYEGCCVSPSIPRPKNLSHSTVSAARLVKALNCATNNSRVEGTRALARDLGDRRSLHVAYHYGNYMADEPWLTIAVCSVDGKHGALFDVAWDSSEYFVTNLPPLLRKRKEWRVGEIFGGLGSYTRLWYLAQEIGSRPRVPIAVAAVLRAKPKSCTVLAVDETGWKPND